MGAIDEQLVVVMRTRHKQAVVASRDVCIARKPELRELTDYMTTLTNIDRDVIIVSFFRDTHDYVCVYTVTQ